MGMFSGVVMGYSNVQLLYSDTEAILSDVLVRYMTCKTRRISRQQYSAFYMGDFRVLATRALSGGFAVASQPSLRKLRFLRRIS